MSSITALTLDQRLLEMIGDWKQHLVTTNLAASTSVVSTHLPNYRSTADYFNDWWIYIEDKNNAGADRMLADDDGTNTLTVRGANFSADSAAATFRISRFSWASRLSAINDALRDVAEHGIAVPVEWRTLIYGNCLPNSHFEDWAAAANPDKYAVTNATAAAQTTNIRGGVSSARVTASAANGYMYVTSDTYPELLDLQGKTVDFKCWANPQTANDATLVIYTKQADGTAQTLTSTTTCPAGEFTLLELESQKLNDNLVEIQFRFKVTTDTKYVDFDDARVTGNMPNEYLLPTDFFDGKLQQVWLQRYGDSDDMVDDIFGEAIPLQHYDVYRKASDVYLTNLPRHYGYPARLHLYGKKQITVLSSGSSTLNVTDTEARQICRLAASLLFDRRRALATGPDSEKYAAESARWRAEYEANKRGSRRIDKGYMVRF